LLPFILNTIKIIFLLGFLIIIHEAGHFVVAKLCKVKVNEFSIGFGKIIWKKQGKETLYTIRLIPLGGFVQMEGETEESTDKRAFSNVNIPKRMAIVSAGAIVNIVFGIIVYFILVSTIGIQFADPAKDTLLNRIYYGGIQTKEFVISLLESIKMLFTSGLSVEQMTGPVGISQIVVQTTTLTNYIYILSIISVSLGVTNLLPIPALDGGKIIILLIEAIRKKKIKTETEVTITLVGFSILIALSLYVTYNDIIRILN
jgi:regulator of sigma E protease